MLMGLNVRLILQTTISLQIIDYGPKNTLFALICVFWQKNREICSVQFGKHKNNNFVLFFWLVAEYFVKCNISVLQSKWIAMKIGPLQAESPILSTPPAVRITPR